MDINNSAGAKVSVEEQKNNENFQCQEEDWNDGSGAVHVAVLNASQSGEDVSLWHPG